ncbi:MAG: hypothetical protein WA624_12645 [Methylocella sp.]
MKTGRGLPAAPGTHSSAARSQWPAWAAALGEASHQSNPVPTLRRRVLAIRATAMVRGLKILLTFGYAENAKGCTRIEGDQEVTRRKRFDPKARGLVGAVKCANVIGARDQRTTSGPTGVMTRIQQAEDMTAPTIKRNANSTTSSASAATSR